MERAGNGRDFGWVGGVLKRGDCLIPAGELARGVVLLVKVVVVSRDGFLVNELGVAVLLTFALTFTVGRGVGDAWRLRGDGGRALYLDESACPL